MTKITASLRNFLDRMQASVNVKSKNILFFISLFLVIFLAIMIRLTPILRGPILIKAFDPWMQYYNAKYISEHSLYEYFHWHDKKSWYPGGITRANLRPGLPFTVVVIYLILNFLGIPVTIYEVCYYFPAFMGGLTVFAAYLLGKEIYDRNCGIFAAFFLALNTGHMQRTMAGFFDNETIGVFATLMSLLFFLKAIRTGKFHHSILGGVFLGYLSLSWGGFQYVFFILPIVCIILILTNKYNENVLISFAGVQGTGFLIYSLYFPFHPDGFFTDFSMSGAFFLIIAIALFHLFYTKKNQYPRFYTIFLNYLKWGIIPGIIILAITIWVKPDLIPLGIGGRLGSLLNPLVREQMSVVASVAEHAPSAWSVFYYNTLIPLMLIPLGIFFCFKRLNAADILLIAFLLTIFYFTGSMIRIILLFGPVASIMGAYGLVNVLKIFGSLTGQKRLTPSRRRKRQLKKTLGNSEVVTVYLLVGVLCLAQVFHATDVSINQLSYSQMVVGGQFHDWEESLVWMKNNLGGTDVVVSWWDYGYWLTPVGNVTTVNDNNTHDGKRMGMTGMALMQTDEIYSAKIFRELKADYVLVYFGFLLSGFGGDEGKWPWMVRICNDNYESYKEDGLEEDNWGEGEVFNEADYINETSGLYRDAWFQSQLVRLMFYDEPTSASGVNPNTEYLKWYYASQIGGNPGQGITARKDDEGDDWKDHIPTNGQYDFKVFKKAYFSKNGLVKLFKIDYTALDSSFSINNPKVYDTGSASFDLKNTGIEDITIKNVSINNINYNFAMGSGGNDLKAGKEDVVWVDIGPTYQIGDVANVDVTAEAIALEGKKYEFTERTDSFFVTKAEIGDVKINKENSQVILNGTKTNVLLEIENTGNIVENLDKFYVNTEENAFNANNIEYLSGSSVISPGGKITVKLYDAPGEFYTASGLKGNLIGVKTTTGALDESLFSINSENYKLSILSEERILSPELIAINSNSTYRTHIPIDLNNADTFFYYNGTIRFDVINKGESVIGLGSVYIAKADSVKYGNIFNITEAYAINPSNWDTIDSNIYLNSGKKNTIIVEASGLNIDVNDEIVIGIKGSGFESGTSIVSDMGLVHAVNKTIDFKILDQVDQTTTSYILANETGVLLLKNTGDKPLTLENIYINKTNSLSFETDVNFISGSASLDIQDCAVVSFNMPFLNINKTNEVIINVTTNTTLERVYTFKALENSPGVPDYYDIEIDEVNTEVDIPNGKFKITVNNQGKTIVNIESIYINDTYIPLSGFDQVDFQIGISSTIELTINSLSVGLSELDKIKLLVRTKEGAEDIVDHHTV